MTTSYTAKDITVLEGLEPVRKRPGMYIGGVGSAGLHHLVWEILDNAIDEAMNGYASSISVTLHADGSSITIVGRRPRHPGGQAPADEEERPRGDLHDAARRRQVRAGQLQDRGRPARRRRQRRQRAVEGTGRHRQARRRAVGAALQAGEAGRPAEEARRRRAAPGTTVFFHPDPTIFPKIEFDPAVIRERLEIASYLHKGAEGRLRRRVERQEGDVRARRRAGRLPAEDRRRARPQADPRGALHARSRRTASAPSSCCSGPRRPTSSCGATSTASRPARAARTRTASARGSARRCATTSRRTTSRRRA